MESPDATADKVAAVEHGDSSHRPGLEAVTLCVGTLYKRGGFLMKSGALYHRHTWKHKECALKAVTFDDRGVYVGPRLEYGSAADGDSGSYVLDGCHVRSFDKKASIWAASDRKDVFCFDLEHEATGSKRSLYATSAEDRDRWIASVGDALARHHLVLAKLAVEHASTHGSREASRVLGDVVE